MLAIPPQVRVFLARRPVDMRKSFHALTALAETVLAQDPMSGHLFMFVNRRGDRIKLLYWGRTGFCIWYQQLEQGTYQLPELAEGDTPAGIELTSAQLSLILEGIDLTSVRQRLRYQRPVRESPLTAVPA